MSDIHKLTGAYALDAVDDLERAAFERHLVECDDCRTEVASLRETTALLAESVAVTPPASLRDSVLSGITQVRPLPPIVAPRRAAWFPVLVAASIVAILGIAAAVWQPWTPSDNGSLTATEQVLRATDAQSVALDLGAAGQATVTRSPSLGKAVIATKGMVSAPTGKVYELWLQSDEGIMVPAGLMPNKPDNTIVLEGDASTAKAAGITIEPAGGSEKPTSAPIAFFDFSQAT